MESVQALARLAHIPLWVIVAVFVWSLVWKGLALWRAALLRHKCWFIVLLVVNTLGLLEIFYLFFISRRYKVLVEVIEEKE